jgi:hypothetical protein
MYCKIGPGYNVACNWKDRCASLRHAKSNQGKIQLLFTSLVWATLALNTLFLFRAAESVQSRSVSKQAADGLLQSGFQNLCQSSISFDVIFTAMLSVVFMPYDDLKVGIFSLCVVPFTGIAFPCAALIAVHMLKSMPTTASKEE